MIELKKDLGMMISGNGKTKRRYGVFVCHCGKEFTTTVHKVKSGHTKSCGCIKGQKKITHGMTRTKLYTVLRSMMQRCENKNNIRYRYYGERGISVCKEWSSDPRAFKEWSMSHGYKEGLEIDRRDPDKGYSPENCRWVPKIINIRNKRGLKMDLYKAIYVIKMYNLGIKRKEIAQHFNVNKTTINKIIRGKNWKEAGSLVGLIT